MITIQVFGTTPPCAKCKRAEREALQAAVRFPDQVEVHKLDALGPEAEPLGLIVTPAVVINGEVLGSGRIVQAEVLVQRIKELLGGI